MSNTLPRASKWVTFLASRSEFPAGEKLLAAFHAGKITRLCDCGCNSFNIEVDEGAAMPLAQPGDRGGAIFELEFRTSEDQHTLEFVVLVGANGQLSGSACNLTRRPSRDSLRLPLASNARPINSSQGESVAITTMSEMWSKLDAYNLNAEGLERAVNHVNEWGGFSRKLGMPVFTAWYDHVEYDRESKTTKAVISDTTWQGTVGVNNQERWIKHAEESGNAVAAFFVIHAANENAHPRKVKYIDDDKVFVGQLVRNGTETYILGQPKPL